MDTAEDTVAGVGKVGNAMLAIGDPEKRAVHGNTFTYIVVALAPVVENLRQMLSFYKRMLALTKVTVMNQHRPSIFW